MRKILWAYANASLRDILYFAILHFAVLYLCSSCTNHYQHLQPTDQPVVVKEQLTSIFYGHEKAQVFDTGIRFRDYYVSGLLVVKAEENERYRIVMTSKLGSKIFDFNLGKEHFVVNFCIDQLDRKLVLNILKKDLRLLTNSYLQPENVTAFTDTLADNTVYRIKTKKGYRHFKYDNSSGHLMKIERGSKRKAKTVVDIGSYQNDLPDKIELRHLQIKLELMLKRLNTGPG